MAVTKSRYVWSYKGRTVESNYLFDTSLIDLDKIKTEILNCDNWEQFDAVIEQNVKIQYLPDKIIDTKQKSLNERSPIPTLTALSQSISQKIKWGGDKCIIWHNKFFSGLKPGLSYYRVTLGEPQPFDQFKKEIKKLSTKTKILNDQDNVILEIFKHSEDFKQLYYQLQLKKQKISPKKYCEFSSIASYYRKGVTSLEMLADLFEWLTPVLIRKWQQDFFNGWLARKLQRIQCSVDDFNQHLEDRKKSLLNYEVNDSGLVYEIDENGDWVITF